jgi:hypothetical protein
MGLNPSKPKSHFVEYYPYTFAIPTALLFYSIILAIRISREISMPNIANSSNQFVELGGSCNQTWELDLSGRLNFLFPIALLPRPV